MCWYFIFYCLSIGFKQPARFVLFSSFVKIAFQLRILKIIFLSAVECSSVQQCIVCRTLAHGLFCFIFELLAKESLASLVDVI